MVKVRSRSRSLSGSGRSTIASAWRIAAPRSTSRAQTRSALATRRTRRGDDELPEVFEEPERAPIVGTSEHAREVLRDDDGDGVEPPGSAASRDPHCAEIERSAEVFHEHDVARDAVELRVKKSLAVG